MVDFLRIFLRRVMKNGKIFIWFSFLLYVLISGTRGAEKIGLQIGIF